MNKEKQDRFVAWLDNRIATAQYIKDHALSDEGYYSGSGRHDELNNVKAKFLSLTKEQDNEQ